MGVTAFLHNLHCDSPQESKDEVVITGPGGQVWPSAGIFSISAGQDVPMNVQVPVNGSVTLRLIEKDPPDGSAGDDLGSVKINASEAGSGTKKKAFLTSETSYTLSYRVV
ncbi:hypothetical protein [Streptomyces sp. A012304]|uniref:hypothetical protein n=1 Tax=Streptomyces sp. A012304 TaxID=375446 RepID=UPI00222E322B|nr:hypothetical protein [Streptomyces sp. A012304]GKQ37783.1 hypothetical protein ALMP_43190 [Streptomyces sp. A012304]